MMTQSNHIFRYHNLPRDSTWGLHLPSSFASAVREPWLGRADHFNSSSTGDLLIACTCMVVAQLGDCGVSPVSEQVCRPGTVLVVGRHALTLTLRGEWSLRDGDHLERMLMIAVSQR